MKTKFLITHALCSFAESKRFINVSVNNIPLLLYSRGLTLKYNGKQTRFFVMYKDEIVIFDFIVNEKEENKDEIKITYKGGEVTKVEYKNIKISYY